MINITTISCYSQPDNSIVPIISILATAITSIFVAWYYNKKNSENLILQMNQQSKNIYVEIHRNEIVTSNKKFYHKIKQGKKSEIYRFLNEEDSMYIPQNLINEVKSLLKKASEDTLSEKEKERILKLFQEYLGLFND